MSFTGKGLPLSFLVMVCLFLYLPRSFACNSTYNWQAAEINEDDLLFMVLRVNNRSVLDSVDVFPVGDTHLVAISQLPDAFDLPWRITFNPNSFRSEYDEHSPLSCGFDIDFTSTAESTVAYWYTDDFDIYVDIRVIATLLGGESSTNFEIMQLNFTSSYERFGSGKKSKQLVSERVYTPLQTLTMVADDYKLLTLPRINYRLDARHDSTKSNTSHSANINGYFDLAYMSTNYRLSNSKTGSKQFLRLSKNFLVDDTITQFKQSIETIDDRSIKYELGDLSLDGDELVGTSLQALGINTFSYSQNRRRNFSSIRIEETVLPGWRARLFRNGEFLEETVSDNDNQVIFSNISTFFGRNEFEIRLFSPEGLEESRTQIVDVGREQLPKGDFDFRIYAADAAKRLLDGNIQNSKERHFGASTTFGIGHNITLNSDYQRQETEDNNFEDYATFGADMNIGDHAIRVRHAKQIGGGQASFVGVNSRLSNKVNASIEHTYLNDFTSSKFSNNADFVYDTKARLNARLGSTKPFSANLNISNRQRLDGSRSLSAGIGVSQSRRGNTLSNKLSYSENRGSHKTVHDAFLTHRIRNFQFSHSLSWQPFDRLDIDSYTMNIRWPQKLKTFQQSNISYRANNKHKFTYRQQASWRYELFNFKLGANINSGGHWNVNIGITGDLFYNKPKQRLQLSKPKGASAAKVEAFAYLDRNRDNQFNGNDEPLVGVGFEGSHNWLDEQTTENGEVQLFTNNRYQKVGVDEGTLYDPFFMPSKPPVLLATHEGGTARIEFPIVTTNDIEGIILQEKEGEVRSLAGLTVNLLEINGANHFTSMTEVDGFFFFTKVPPGRYMLQLDKEKLQDFRLAIPEEAIVIEAPEEGDIVSLDDIVLIDSKTHKSIEQAKLEKEADAYSGLQRQAYLALKASIQASLAAIDNSQNETNGLLAHAAYQKVLAVSETIN
ncbi:hypothetical protein [Agaribacter marinus]|uniref:Carboxypeptidase regulatory-like domain-containing protein n=1 Tax=Agaribacter marinus TaxID=1431249 RepID=A0AA37T4M8_9ALTE|nr:hypothetical protein [Agaribacter marinus]GLR71290.1 hypothetical protein GCM10007852_21980 [Agaribacter marinus]